jgi:hypothetical protein
MEAVGRQIQTKIDIARLLFDRLTGGGIDEVAAQKFQSELAAQEVRYALSTGHLFLKAASGESGRLAAKEEFARVIAAENFGGEIDSIVDRAESALRAAHRQPDRPAASGKKAAARKTAALPLGTRETLRSKTSKKAADMIIVIPTDIQRVIDTYPHAGKMATSDDALKKGIHSGAAPGSMIPRIEYEKCSGCNAEMIIDPDHSELRCLICSAVRELDGTAFDDAQFYSQEGQKAKSGTFNPNRHFQFWWMHILAREPEEELGDPNDPDNNYGEKLLDGLRAIVRRDRKILRFLSVDDSRAMLRELDRTNLNKDVPLILKKLTGIGPPSPPDSLGMKVEKLFSKAIEIGERLRRADRTNRNYYPFYLLKILDCILPEKDENRRILYYIYLQSDETLAKDDDEWKAICEEMDPEDGIIYKPTDRTLAMKYRPD